MGSAPNWDWTDGFFYLLTTVKDPVVSCSYATPGALVNHYSMWDRSKSPFQLGTYGVVPIYNQIPCSH